MINLHRFPSDIVRAAFPEWSRSKLSQRSCKTRAGQIKADKNDVARTTNLLKSADPFYYNSLVDRHTVGYRSKPSVARNLLKNGFVSSNGSLHMNKYEAVEVKRAIRVIEERETKISQLAARECERVKRLRQIPNVGDAALEGMCAKMTSRGKNRKGAPLQFEKTSQRAGSCAKGSDARAQLKPNQSKAKSTSTSNSTRLPSIVKAHTCPKAATNYTHKSQAKSDLGPAPQAAAAASLDPAYRERLRNMLTQEEERLKNIILMELQLARKAEQKAKQIEVRVACRKELIEAELKAERERNRLERKRKAVLRALVTECQRWAKVKRDKANSFDIHVKQMKQRVEEAIQERRIQQLKESNSKLPSSTPTTAAVSKGPPPAVLSNCLPRSSSNMADSNTFTMVVSDTFNVDESDTSNTATSNTSTVATSNTSTVATSNTSTVATSNTSTVATSNTSTMVLLNTSAMATSNASAMATSNTSAMAASNTSTVTASTAVLCSSNMATKLEGPSKSSFTGVPPCSPGTSITTVSFYLPSSTLANTVAVSPSQSSTTTEVFNVALKDTDASVVVSKEQSSIDVAPSDVSSGDEHLCDQTPAPMPAPPFTGEEFPCPGDLTLATRLAEFPAECSSEESLIQSAADGLISQMVVMPAMEKATPSPVSNIPAHISRATNTSPHLLESYMAGIVDVKENTTVSQKGIRKGTFSHEEHSKTTSKTIKLPTRPQSAAVPPPLRDPLATPPPLLDPLSPLGPAILTKWSEESVRQRSPRNSVCSEGDGERRKLEGPEHTEVMHCSSTLAVGENLPMEFHPPKGTNCVLEVKGIHECKGCKEDEEYERGNVYEGHKGHEECEGGEHTSLANVHPSHHSSSHQAARPPTPIAALSSNPSSGMHKYSSSLQEIGEETEEPEAESCAVEMASRERANNLQGTAVQTAPGECCNWNGALGAKSTAEQPLEAAAATCLQTPLLKDGPLLSAIAPTNGRGDVLNAVSDDPHLKFGPKLIPACGNDTLVSKSAPPSFSDGLTSQSSPKCVRGALNSTQASRSLPHQFTSSFQTSKNAVSWKMKEGSGVSKVNNYGDSSLEGSKFKSVSFSKPQRNFPKETIPENMRWPSKMQKNQSKQEVEKKFTAENEDHEKGKTSGTI